MASSTAASCSARSALQGCKPRGLAAFSSPTTMRVQKRQTPAPVRAELNSAEAALALTQQAVAFAAVVGAEAAYIGLTTPATATGRPSVISTLGGVGATIAAVALVQQQAPLNSAGYGLGFAASVYFFAYYLQRAKDTDNGEDWPGNKAWPSVLALISFFSLSAFLQALLPSLGLK